jgi:imidazoleglycerol-phosphate dehydratase
MSDTQSDARIAPADVGVATVETGLPVLDHLIAELARTGRFRLHLEVAPGSADEVLTAAGRALGRAIAARLDADGVAGAGFAIMPADEALAMASLERAPTGNLVTNVDFSDERVGGVATDVVTRFLEEVASVAGLNLHVRLVEGTDPQHVLAAIFKAVGAALGAALRRTDRQPEEEQ